MDGAEVGVLKEAHMIGLGGLLEAKDCSRLESEVCLKILGNLPHEALEGELADEIVGGLLEATDLAESDGSRAVAVGLLYAARGGGGLASGLRC